MYNTDGNIVHCANVTYVMEKSLNEIKQYYHCMIFTFDSM